MNLTGWLSITQKVGDDFISLSDIANGFDDRIALIEKWTRTKSTIEFLAVWERLNNPNFNSLEFEAIRKKMEQNSFIISIKQ